MKSISRLFLVVIIVILAGQTAFGQFNVLETQHVRLIYFGELQSFLVPYVAQCTENSLRFHRQFWDYHPSEKTTIFLHDLYDYGNAGASTAPKNKISIAAAPINYSFDITPANERMNSTMNHEVVHLVASEKAVGSDKFFRSIFFGKISETDENPLTILYGYLTTPRRSSPRWYHEGIAVFLETWMTGGLGRVLGPWDEMAFRTMVHDSARIYGVVGLEAEGQSVDFQVGVNAYLYGTRFMSYLAYKYGPDKLIAWTNRTDGSSSYFMSQFHKVYGRPMAEVWDEWIEWERQFQQQNLATVREYPVTPERDISSFALGSVSRAYYDSTSNRLLAAVNYPGEVAHIAAIDVATGDIDRVCDVKGAALFFVSSVTYDQASGRMFYTEDNNSWRDLCVVDVHTGDHRVLLKDCRVGDLAYNRADSSVWGVRHYNGISTIVRIPPPYTEWNYVMAFPYGKDIYDIDVDPDGRRLSGALTDIAGLQKLIVMDIDGMMAGDTTYDTLFDFHNSGPANFTFSDDGRYLCGSSYYTGVSNVFRYDLQADSMEALSNCETGFFRPMVFSKDSLIVFRFTTKGFVPSMIPYEVIEDINPITYLGQMVVDSQPVVKDWVIDPPTAVDLDTMTISRGPYHAFRTIRPVGAYPIVEGYKDFAAFGVRSVFQDRLGLHSADLTASYTENSHVPKNERFHAMFNYIWSNWQLSVTHNRADFYDLFGPTKTSRKGSSLGLTYKRSLIYDPPRALQVAAGATGYINLKRLPAYQNITTSYDKLLSFNTNVAYSNRRASLGAVDYEKGYNWKIAVHGNYVNRKLFPLFGGEMHFGFPWLVHHSSLWFRNYAGYSPGEPKEPFANFYFGGFGNNYIDHGAVKRYRMYYSFPGTDLNEVGGTNFLKSAVEWNLPPLRFRHIGAPSFFFTWARLSLFSMGIITNIENDAPQYKYGSVGAQLDLRMILLSHLNFTFSVGYARAYPENERGSDEFMLSLKVL